MAILTVNTGSSSLKVAVYEDAGTLLLRGAVERIGHNDSRLRLSDANGATLHEEHEQHADHATATAKVLAWLTDCRPQVHLTAVGHRLVHGGPRYHTPQRLTRALLDALAQCVPLAPSHLPQALAAIKAVTHLRAELTQVACFDTAFHHSKPRLAQLTTLTRQATDAELMRYGFHGLSYESIMQQLHAIDAHAAKQRVVIAHLGNGASMAAVRDGVSRDTTMGFTPTGGLMMGTRCGDLDPGLVLYLLREKHLTIDALDQLVNRQGGLLGISETSADVRDLLERAPQDTRAAEAIDLFCYTARKHLGSMTTVIGGLDTLVFTGGIGEHAAPIRARICADLSYLGVAVDNDRNAAHASIISPERAAVTVRIIQTDEDLMIAQHTLSLMRLQREGAMHADS